MPPSLSVVIPVYNEPEWIGRTVARVEEALSRSPWEDAEIVVVDDGSRAETKAALAELGDRIRLISQPNSGRFLARRAGIEAARGELVLLLDSRVLLHPEALAWVAEHIADGRRVWNGHCLINTDGNHFARFWDVMTQAGFAEYFSDPRTTSFGLEEYDRFPKGTTHFLAPRDYLLDAIDGFSSFYDDLSLVSDDTHMLRAIAGRERINISPHFSSLYHARTTLKGFLKQALYRGTTFVDSFGRPGSRFFWVVVAAFPAPVAALLVALRFPRLAAAALLAAPPAAGGLVLRKGRPREHALSFALLAVPFSVVYTAGIWRGAWLALQARRSR